MKPSHLAFRLVLNLKFSPMRLTFSTSQNTPPSATVPIRGWGLSFSIPISNALLYHFNSFTGFSMALFIVRTEHHTHVNEFILTTTIGSNSIPILQMGA